MKYFIVEDDLNLIKILEKIIHDRKLGEVIGYAQDGQSGLEKIVQLEPDIVLVDLFMPGKDGITMVSELVDELHDVAFVMISQVSAKDMISRAYESGVEFYIQKPINSIEVESVLRRVAASIEKTRKLSKIKNLFSLDLATPKQKVEPDSEAKIKQILQKIGVIGESGTQDIIDMTSFLVSSGSNLSTYTIKELCNQFGLNSKTIEQRIRRTATIGMINLAHMGIEDYMNESFLEYSNGLYNFSEVKREMDCIRGKTSQHGKVSLRKFIDGLVLYCEN